RVRLSAVLKPPCLDSTPLLLPLRILSPRRFGYGRNHIPSQPSTIENLVPHGVVDHQSEIWIERIGVAAHDGNWQLRNSMGRPSEVAPRDGVSKLPIP